MGKTLDSMSTRDKLIKHIVMAEWEAFDKVINEGGRAGCQDDFYTFSIMRKSQYMTWTDDMLEEYLYHFTESYNSGRNLIEEKYGRMMESTAVEKYEKIKDNFVTHTKERISLQEAIIEIQVDWMEEVASKYPNVAYNARSIHTYEDNPYNTSYETYLRGELGTYSEELIAMYGQFIVDLKKQNKNLALMTMDNTAKLYGYKDIEDINTR